MYELQVIEIAFESCKKNRKNIFFKNTYFI